LFIRETTLTFNFVYSYAINICQSLFELDVLVSMGNINTADATI